MFVLLVVTDVPSFNKLPKDLSVDEGQTAEFYCDVAGDPVVSVQWSKENGAISYGRYEAVFIVTQNCENIFVFQLICSIEEPI